jgi:hypothetical protein
MRLWILSYLLARRLCDGNNGAFLVATALAVCTTTSGTRTRLHNSNAIDFAFADHHSGIVISNAWLLCRSNDTHIAWRESDATNLHGGDDSNDNDCSWQLYEQAYRDAYDYLRANIMDFDEPNLETLGFQRHESNTTSPDGLVNGLIQPVIELSLRNKRDFVHTDALPKEIWRNYVLNYANLNEARSNIRPCLHQRVVTPLLLDNTANREANVSEVVRLLNTHAWPLISLNNQTIHFVASQTPLVDTLDCNPWERWFCHADRLVNGTQFYAAQACRESPALSKFLAYPTSSWHC